MDPTDVRIRFHPSETSVVAASGTTLMEAMHRAGLPLASACGASSLCGRCGVRVTSGAASLSPESENESSAKRRNRIDATLRLACCTTVSGDVDLTATYW